MGEISPFFYEPWAPSMLSSCCSSCQQVGSSWWLSWWMSVFSLCDVMHDEVCGFDLKVKKKREGFEVKSTLTLTVSCFRCFLLMIHWYVYSIVSQNWTFLNFLLLELFVSFALTWWFCDRCEWDGHTLICIGSLLYFRQVITISLKINHNIASR